MSERNTISAVRKNSLPQATDYRIYKLSFREVVGFAGILLLTGIVISYVFYDTIIPGILLFIPIVRRSLKIYRKHLFEKRKRRLKKEFLAAAGFLSDYLRSGYSVENAVRSSVKELRELFGERSDILREWKAMAAALGVNRTAEEVFRDFGERSGVEQIRDFSEIFSVVKRSGGMLQDVIRAACMNISEEFAVEEQIQTMIAAKKLEQKMMNVMPAAILLYIKTASPELLASMYGTLTGRLIMTTCLLVYGAAFLWAEKITDIQMK